MSNVNIFDIAKMELMVAEGVKKVAHFYSVKPISIVKDTVNHHILLVDESGSMWDSIETLKEKLKICLEQLTVDGNNYVSIITYCGHSQSRVIVNAVKCDKVSYKMAKVYETIQNEIHAHSVTVMSEPLDKSILIVKGLADVCDNHHIALFTDGCLVPTNWGYREEENKCFEVAEICKRDNIILNAIGFGRYYDRDFLKSLVSKASNGQLVHIDEIEDYAKTILELIRMVNNSEVIEVSIENKDFFVLNGVKKFSSPTIIKNFQKNTDNIIVTFDEELVIDGTKYEVKSNKMDDSILEDFLYSLSLYHVINEDVDSAEIVMAQTGDIALFNVVNNCYSFEEKGKVMNALNETIIDKSKRFTEGKKEISVLTAEEEPICLLEILDEILKDKDSSLLWDSKYKYKRITQKTKQVHDSISFVYPTEGYSRVTSISIGSSKLNIGVNVEFNGKSRDEESGLEIPAKIFKDYNLIVNGNINTEELCCVLSNELYVKFKDMDIIKKSIVWNNQTVHVIDLNKIKSTNKRTLKLMSQEEIAKGLERIEDLGVHQWAIKQVIKQVVGEEDKLELSNLSEEEKELRRFLRVNEKGVYEPLKVEKDEVTAFEVYPSIVMEWKVEKYPTKQNQTNFKSGYENDIQGLERDEAFELLNKKLFEVQTEKRTLEQRINIVRISSALIGKSVFLWENTVSKNKKANDKTLNRNMVIGEAMDVSTKKVEEVNVRQDKYTLLVKAN